MSRTQIIRMAILTAIILVVVVVLDFLVNVVVAPGLTPYTPLGTIAITLVVAPVFTGYLILQNAKVERATAALAEERVARLAADGANQAKTQFIANMSHELRTPLNAIIGYAEMIEEASQMASQVESTEDAQRIQRSARHLLSLIVEILDHARLETGKFDLCNAPTALDGVFSEVVEMSRAAAAANGNTLEAACEADIGSAYIDPVRLRQCMLNLTSNAAKFTENGHIRLRMRHCDDAFVFEVADTGIGMSETTIARLFEPFVQADGSQTRKYDGTGLGLAITKQLMDLMGGTIQVVSTPGQGTVFTLRLRRGAIGANVVTLAA